MYGYYDKVDYSQKSISELKSQLVLHAESFRASKIKFNHKYEKKYTLPNGFN